MTVESPKHRRWFQFTGSGDVALSRNYEIPMISTDSKASYECPFLQVLTAIPVLVLSSLLIMMFGGCTGVLHQFQIENATGEEIAVTSGHTQKTVRIPDQETVRVPHGSGNITVTMQDGKTWLYRNLSPADLSGTPFLVETSSVFGGSRTVNLLLQKNGHLYVILPDANKTDIERLKQPASFPIKPEVGKRVVERNVSEESPDSLKMDHVRKQTEAIDTIAKAGGTVDIISSAKPSILQGMRAQFGTEFSDAEAAKLKGLTSVAILNLSGAQVTDVGLEHLKGMTGLVSLDLKGTQVTGAGFKHLKGLANLAELNLSDTQVTDTELEHLKGLTNLECLILANTQVTDSGIEHLREMTVFDRLWLDCTQVTDTGLEYLKGLTNLRSLSVRDTQVTDAGLAHLTGLTKLKYLDLNGTQATSEGVKKLQEALPNCKIDY